MKRVKSEYLIDRLNETISALESRVEALVKENKALQEECRFGAAVAAMLGLCIGVVIGTVVAWQ